MAWDIHTPLADIWCQLKVDLGDEQQFLDNRLKQGFADPFHQDAVQIIAKADRADSMLDLFVACAGRWTGPNQETSLMRKFADIGIVKTCEVLAMKPLNPDRKDGRELCTAVINELRRKWASGWTGRVST